MNSQDSFLPTPDDLLAWRVEEDAVRLISEKLRVKEMGPADHIRTKHEVKAFVETGEWNAAKELVKRAQVRRELAQTAAIQQSQTHGQTRGVAE